MTVFVDSVTRNLKVSERIDRRLGRNFKPVDFKRRGNQDRKMFSVLAVIDIRRWKRLMRCRNEFRKVEIGNLI